MEPTSIAIVGASMSGTGHTVVANLKALGYTGQVACVNPKYQDILGFPCFASLDDLPYVPDTVLMAVARERVVGILETAAAKGAKSAVVLAIGFGEADDEGRVLQEQLVRVASEAGMAVLGPNCQGYVNFAKPVALYMDTVATDYPAGRVGLIAQSGSVVTALTNNRRGVRWSHIVSSGNEATVDAAAMLEYYVASPDVDVVCAFLESIRRPEKFFAQCDLAYEVGKPIVVVKTGRTVAAQNAATAHSGALAVPDRLVDALLRRHRVSRADSLEELLETAIALQSKKRPKGGRLGVMTASGGQIELVLDNLPGTDLTVEPFTSSTQTTLSAALPSFLEPKNPLDWWGTPNYETAVTALVDAVASDEHVDVVVQAADFTAGPTGVENRADHNVAMARELHATHEELFVVLDGVGGAPTAANAEAALADGVLVLAGFEKGLRALGHLVRYSQASAPVAKNAVVAERSILSDAQGSQNVAFDLLRSVGLVSAEGIVVADEDEANTVADQLGFPVVAKIANEGAAHKSDQGGVILNITSHDELDDAMKKLRSIGANRFLIQRQITDGVEIYLGLQSQPTLGTFVIVGLGGIWTELLDDVQIRPVGLLEGEAHEMIRALRGYKRLTGARGAEPVDLDVLADCIMRVDALGAGIGDLIESLDINPMILTGSSAVAVDALLVRRS